MHLLLCPSHCHTKGFPTPKKPGRSPGPLRAPCEAKFPTPSPCKARLWHGTKDLQTAGGCLVDPALV